MNELKFPQLALPTRVVKYITSGIMDVQVYKTNTLRN